MRGGGKEEDRQTDRLTEATSDLRLFLRVHVISNSSVDQQNDEIISRRFQSSFHTVASGEQDFKTPLDGNAFYATLNHDGR